MIAIIRALKVKYFKMGFFKTCLGFHLYLLGICLTFTWWHLLHGVWHLTFVIWHSVYTSDAFLLKCCKFVFSLEYSNSYYYFSKSYWVLTNFKMKKKKGLCSTVLYFLCVFTANSVPVELFLNWFIRELIF